jgi:ADP-ribose pyrophosphatase YjhB (NUDIX family)
MVGLVEHVHLASTAGAPTSAVVEAEAVAGVGLRGDRYADGAGYWRDGRVSRDLTLVEGEVVDELPGVAPGELRRNVTTRGVSLNDLVGSTFWVGEALCRGTELCEPCRHLEELTGKPLLRPLVHRGGLRARILSGGILRVGDDVAAAEELDGVGVLVERDGRVLLGRRLAPHGYGTWSCPGGKPEPGETPLECAERELYEETGLEARAGQVVAETVDGFGDSRTVYRTRFVSMADVTGEPRRREPAKVEGWCWYPWESLPEPLFAPVASLLAARSRR